VGMRRRRGVVCVGSIYPDLSRPQFLTIYPISVDLGCSVTQLESGLGAYRSLVPTSFTGVPL